MKSQFKTFTVALAAAVFTTIFSPTQAQAYDEDTHFYGTYAMARHAGIAHPVAMKIALSSQWMDESYISDPTSMIFLPVTGIKKRRLLHFPSSRMNGAGSSTVQRQIFGMDDLGEFSTSIVKKVETWSKKQTSVADINFFTETIEDHPFASQMLMEGLKEGNLMKASAGLHTLEDSFAHAGTPAEQGHALFWHWPDRPFASVAKYKRMVNSMMSALVAIRTMLPQEALDCSINTAGNTPNCQAGTAELTQSYIPLIQPIMSHDMLRDPLYIKVALDEFWQRAKEARYTQMTKDEFHTRVEKLNLVQGQTNSYEAIQQLLVQILEESSGTDPKVLDFGKILIDMGKIRSADVTSVQQYIDNYGRDGMADMRGESLASFTRVLSTELLAWHVPVDLNDSHRMELEDDHNHVRNAEMEYRILNMQKFIQEQFGTKVIFVGNNTKSSPGFYKEMHLDPTAEPDFQSKDDFVAEPSAVYATFSVQEKYQFNSMILSYLFPTMSKKEIFTVMDTVAKIKKLLADRSTYYKERAVIEADKNINWMTRKYLLLKLDWQYKRYKDISAGIPEGVLLVLNNIKPLADKYISDIVSTHITPSEDNFVYRRKKALLEYANQGKVKQLLGESDVWSKDILKNTRPVP